MRRTKYQSYYDRDRKRRDEEFERELTDILEDTMIPKIEKLCKKYFIFGAITGIVSYVTLTKNKENVLKLVDNLIKR